MRSCIFLLFIFSFFMSACGQNETQPEAAPVNPDSTGSDPHNNSGYYISEIDYNYFDLKAVISIDPLSLVKSLAKRVKDNDLSDLLNELKQGNNKDAGGIFPELIRRIHDRNISAEKYFGVHGRSDSLLMKYFTDEALKARDYNMNVVQKRLEDYAYRTPQFSAAGTLGFIFQLQLDTSFIKSAEDVQSIIKLISQEGKLEFRMTADPGITVNTMLKIDKYLRGGTDIQEKNSDTLDEEEFKLLHPFFSALYVDRKALYPTAYVYKENLNKIKKWLADPFIQKYIPPHLEFLFSARSYESDGKEIYSMHCLEKTSIKPGSIESASVVPGSSGEPDIFAKLDPAGKRLFAEITKKNIRKQLAIVIDGAVYTAALIKGEIVEGRLLIEGLQNSGEAEVIAALLDSSPLKLPQEVKSYELMPRKRKNVLQAAAVQFRQEGEGVYQIEDGYSAYFHKTPLKYELPPDGAAFYMAAETTYTDDGVVIMSGCTIQEPVTTQEAKEYLMENYTRLFSVGHEAKILDKEKIKHNGMDAYYIRSSYNMKGHEIISSSLIIMHNNKIFEWTVEGNGGITTSKALKIFEEKKKDFVVK